MAKFIPRSTSRRERSQTDRDHCPTIPRIDFNSITRLAIDQVAWKLNGELHTIARTEQGPLSPDEINNLRQEMLHLRLQIEEDLRNKQEELMSNSRSRAKKASHRHPRKQTTCVSSSLAEPEQVSDQPAIETALQDLAAIPLAPGSWRQRLKEYQERQSKLVLLLDAEDSTTTEQQIRDVVSKLEADFLAVHEPEPDRNQYFDQQEFDDHWQEWWQREFHTAEAGISAYCSGSLIALLRNSEKARNDSRMKELQAMLLGSKEEEKPSTCVVSAAVRCLNSA
jgi:hypothetical protein